MNFANLPPRTDIRRQSLEIRPVAGGHEAEKEGQGNKSTVEHAAARLQLQDDGDEGEGPPDVVPSSQRLSGGRHSANLRPAGVWCPRISVPWAKKPSEDVLAGVERVDTGASIFRSVHGTPLETALTRTVPTLAPKAPWLPMRLRKVGLAIWKLLRFVGPGFMVAVAYIDPGNYSTDISAGAQTRFALLFVVLLSNIFAVVLQSLAIRLGTVTGKDLAQNCREHLPKWLNLGLYFFAEAAIIATDIAEVIGTAIALNLLFHIPLVAGCAISIVGVLFILIFYRPNGSMRGMQVFEWGMVCLVLAVTVCFCIQLSLISDTTVGEVFRGYVPSATVVQGEGIYLSCGILGATVMPHSLYLGSGIVKTRLHDYDQTRAQQRQRELASSTAASSQATLTAVEPPKLDDEKNPYRPSIDAIRHCLTASTVELVLSLCIFALFVNSAILITAGADLSSESAAASADLFGIYDLLCQSISQAAGTIFALALLLSGLSAGIVCTIAGQIVSEGAIRWTMRPWARQLVVRSVSIVPSIIIAGAVGREGLDAALNGSQVALSVILPFVSAPLVYFTCRNKFMTVGRPLSAGPSDDVNTEGDTYAERALDGEAQTERIGMRNHWLVSALAILIWIVIAIMNIALLVFVGLGDD